MQISFRERAFPPQVRAFPEDGKHLIGVFTTCESETISTFAAKA
jgi:hypothetical protein